MIEYIDNSEIENYVIGSYKNRLLESHQRFIHEIEQKNEEKMSRTQELNSSKVIALKELGYKDIPDEWVKSANELTEDEKNRFIIADNVGFGDWDFEMLESDWSLDDMSDWGLDMNLDKSVENYERPDIKLEDRFIIPPFSILDTRQGYWRRRKKHWNELIQDNGESRENTLGNKKPSESESDLFRQRGFDVSILDPVLAEISNVWFGLENCNTFDCFAGDSVFGYVSDALGNNFTGIELRQEQADLNNERLSGSKSKYICDDGQNVLKHIEENSQDLLFSCPPYFDLEVYSDLENDASNQKDYKDFLVILDNAFTDAIKCLKDNRFAVIVVGDIRDKKGYYYRFVDDIKDIFKKSGVLLYNELILVNPVGSMALIANKTMESRKVAKVHQNMLVFYKGDTKQIKKIYDKIDFSTLIEEAEQKEKEKEQKED
jgi:hypothetical protein